MRARPADILLTYSTGLGKIVMKKNAAISFSTDKNASLFGGTMNEEFSMNRIIVLFGILAIVFAVCFSGCSAQNNIVITDSKSGETVAEFSSKEHQAEAAALTNALNGTGEVSGEIDYSEKYLVHFIDPKDPLYDIWYYAYLNDDSNAVYIQFDLEKMKDYNKKSDGFFDDKIHKSSKLTADEFSEIISAKYQ